ncbi:hypothetical protein MRX96_022420 [Rhipicephalus microplus]
MTMADRSPVKRTWDGLSCWPVTNAGAVAVLPCFSFPERPFLRHDEERAFLYIVLTYLMGTNFFWMFVEGLYLYILVVKTFSVELVRIHVYAFIGWGLPAIVVTVWSITKAYFSANRSDPVLFDGLCVWQLKDIYDCVFICPVAIVLLFGRCVFIKSRLSNITYRKAAKALLVLTPLLGVTYVLVIWTPSHKTAKTVFTYLQITLLSTQGFTVAVLYCFFNGEVRSTIRHHLQRWRTSRALCAEQKKQGLNYRVGSRRPSSAAVSSIGIVTPVHGDAGRLYKGRAPRSSCISFASTTSTVAPHTGYLGPAHRFSNGAFGPTGKDDVV